MHIELTFTCPGRAKGTKVKSITRNACWIIVHLMVRLYIEKSLPRHFSTNSTQIEIRKCQLSRNIFHKIEETAGKNKNFGRPLSALLETMYGTYLSAILQDIALKTSNHYQNSLVFCSDEVWEKRNGSNSSLWEVLLMKIDVKCLQRKT